MKNMSIIVLLLLMLGTNGPIFIQAQDRGITPELENALANRNGDEKKLESNLFCDLFKYNEAIANKLPTNEAIQIFSSDIYIKDTQNRILVKITLNTQNLIDIDEVKDLIIRDGGKIKNSFSGGNHFPEIYCYLQIDQINTLTSLPIIRIISIVVEGVHNYR